MLQHRLAAALASLVSDGMIPSGPEVSCKYMHDAAAESHIVRFIPCAGPAGCYLQRTVSLRRPSASEVLGAEQRRSKEMCSRNSGIPAGL